MKGYKHKINRNVKCSTLLAHPASYHSNVKNTLIHWLIHEHDFCPNLSIGCGGEDNNSLDSMLIHSVTKLHLCYCFEKQPLVAKLTYCAFNVCCSVCICCFVALYFCYSYKTNVSNSFESNYSGRSGPHSPN